MPIFATVIIWDALDRLVQILAVVLLLTLTLKHWGFNVNIASKLRKTKFGQALSFIIRSTTSVTKLNEEYFDETSELIATHTKNIIMQVKKGGKKMEKINKFRSEALLWLNHNKKQILALLSILLFAIDYYFGFTKKAGLSPDIVYTISGAIFLIALWAMGGEGWTSNTFNRLKQTETIAKTETKKTVKLYQKELNRIDAEIKDVLKYNVAGLLPPNKKEQYDKLIQDQNYYKEKIDAFLKKIENEELD